METLAEMAKKAHEELVKKTIPIASIKDAELRGMLYDLTEDGPNSDLYRKLSVYPIK